MIRDNVKRQITPLLTNCIHMPKTAAGAQRGRTASGQLADPGGATTPGGKLMSCIRVS